MKFEFISYHIVWNINWINSWVKLIKTIRSKIWIKDNVKVNYFDLHWSKITKHNLFKLKCIREMANLLVKKSLMDFTLLSNASLLFWSLPQKSWKCCATKSKCFTSALKLFFTLSTAMRKLDIQRFNTCYCSFNHNQLLLCICFNNLDPAKIEK